MILHSLTRFRRWKKIKKYSCVLGVAALIWAVFNILASYNRIHNDGPKSRESHDRIYKERVQYAKSQCEHSTQGSVAEVYLHEESKLIYCPVAKIGSTFWKRVYLFLHNDTGNYHAKNPFQIPRGFVHYGKKVRTQVLKMNTTTERKILGNYTRFMFVRDPYSRLWSAYLDKFFLLDFWRTYAKSVVKKRIAPTQKAKDCANDVTFQEFLEYVASLPPVNMNEHWQPIKSRCDPCKLKPDIIGKQETFGEDSSYILQSIGRGWITEAFDSDVQVEEEISMLADYNFGLLLNAKKFYQNCTTKDDIARRLWKVFQINGYLPLTETADEAVEYLTKSHFDVDIFKECVLKSYRQYPSIERKSWKAQRKDAIIIAYKSLPNLLLRRVSEIFRDDFESFGYEIQPPGVADWMF